MEKFREAAKRLAGVYAWRSIKHAQRPAVQKSL